MKKFLIQILICLGIVNFCYAAFDDTTDPQDGSQTVSSYMTIIRNNFRAISGTSSSLPALQVDNININGNTISATTGAINITPLAGSAIVLDGTINVDAGVVTGITSIVTPTITGAGTTTGIGLTITNSTPTTTFSIRDDGILTTALQSSARAYLGTIQENLTDTTYTKVLLDTENWDTQSEFASNKFTCKVAGKYLATGVIRYGGIIADKIYSASIYVDGGQAAEGYGHSASASVVTITITDVVNLTVGQYVELYAYVNVGASTVDITSGTGYTYLSVIKIN